MKKNISISEVLGLAGVVVLVMLLSASCKKYDSTGFTPGTGAPVITAVHTWNKTDTTTYYDTLYSYDASGNLVETLRERSNRIIPFDSATNAGNLSGYYVIKGDNLGSVSSITFNGFSAYYNRALITDNSIIVQIPSKTPYQGPEANDSLVVTTLYGSAAYKFVILPPPPTPSDYSNYNYSAGSRITIEGVGFANVTGVTVEGANGETGMASVISKSDEELVLQFSSSAVTRGILNFSYDAGGVASTVKGTQELVNLDNSYHVFIDDYMNGWGSWSWDDAGPSGDKAKSGTASWRAQYGGGGWKVNGLRNGGGGDDDGVAYSEGYQFLSLWIHGGNDEQIIYIEFGNLGLGNDGSANARNAITIPPGEWTYFKIPINTLLWNTGNDTWDNHTSEKLNTIAFFMNSNSETEQIYFDDIILIK